MRSNAIRMAARGHDCTFQIPGVCNHNQETVVLCHLPSETHGMARKADDIAAAFGCSSCHDMVDGRSRPTVEFTEYKEWYMRRAMERTWRSLIQQGVITIKGLKQ